MMDNYFINLAQINVKEHIEKKGKFSYLSWPFAVAELSKHHPSAKWKIKRFNDGNGNKVPYLKTDLGYFVEASVTVNEVTRTQIHPVLDNYNKPIAKPNTFDINTSIQRCLVKAIALHGLGLYIYAGEDLPNITGKHHTGDQLDTYTDLLGYEKAIEFYSFLSGLHEDVQKTLHNSFKSDKVKNKKRANDLYKSGAEMIDKYVDSLNDLAEKEDNAGLIELTEELTNNEKSIIWAVLSPQAKATIKAALATSKEKESSSEPDISQESQEKES